MNTVPSDVPNSSGTTSSRSNRNLLITASVILAVAAGAYTVGRVYPPLEGTTQGTLSPAARYVEPQIGTDDVTLGDTSVPQLMQTDAFEVMVKNPSFRALASDPGFAALAQNRSLMSAIAADPAAFAHFQPVILIQSPDRERGDDLNLHAEWRCWRAAAGSGLEARGVATSGRWATARA